uniref:Uncharacterized protein n=1 Tax=Anguilla anguilla TaxID=7936 RepID=A0A0E9W003_ANGAN
MFGPRLCDWLVVDCGWL